MKRPEAVTAIARKLKLRRRAVRAARKLGLPEPMGRNWHRSAVGGKWDEMGRFQFDYLVGDGLAPEHFMLDVGCGSLRGGVHFIRYLQGGHYHGVDADARLLAAGRKELEQAGISDKRPVLVADDQFQLVKFEQAFDFILAQSVFSHLPFNKIARCMAEVERVLAPGGRFYATFFANTGPRLRTDQIPVHADVSLNINLDRDPFYYDPDIFRWLCDGSDLDVDYRGDWGHPRTQHMLVFTKRGAAPEPAPQCAQSAGVQPAG
jgi:SAM-dependent methyltransferase